jgi:hypothetical protein
MLIMAGVLDLLRLHHHKRAMHYNSTVLELEAAKEILAEIFRVSILDVDEMIQNRFELAASQDKSYDSDGLWPREFRLE